MTENDTFLALKRVPFDKNLLRYINNSLEDYSSRHDDPYYRKFVEVCQKILTI